MTMRGKTLDDFEHEIADLNAALYYQQARIVALEEDVLKLKREGITREDLTTSSNMRRY